MSEVASSAGPRSHAQQALGQPEHEVRQARGQEQDDERDDESAHTDECADVLEMEQPREPFPEPLSQLDILIPHLADDRAHRGVEQAILAVAVVADDVEDPDMADRIGHGRKLPARPPTWAIDSLRSAAGRRVEGDPDRDCYPPAQADVGLDPAMGVLLPDVHRFGQLVPVAPLEAVDHARRDVDRPEQERERTGEILAMTRSCD